MPLEIRSVQKLRVYVHLVLEDGDRAEAMGAEDAGGGCSLLVFVPPRLSRFLCWHESSRSPDGLCILLFQSLDFRREIRRRGERDFRTFIRVYIHLEVLGISLW